jgi:hypothetical protein
MARSDVFTFGLLNRWPLVVREDVFTYNQFAGAGVLSIPNRQNVPYIQSERDYIATALHDAARHAADHLGFFPAPAWVEEETVMVNRDYGYSRQTYEARWAHIETFGRRAVTAIQPGVTVTYTDADNDGVQETATITVTTTVDADEIQVFFPTADGAPSVAHPAWQIERLTVTKVGDTATITGHKALFAHPQKVWAVEYDNHNFQTKHAGNPASSDDFVTAVDVYRVYADPTNAVQLVMNPNIVGVANTPIDATADIVDSRMGYFTVRTDSAQTSPAAPPVAVKIWYKAGLPLVNGAMNRQLETALIRYANTLLPQEPAMLPRSIAMYPDDRKPFEQPLPYVPVFGLTQAGVYLARIVDGLQHKLKGKPVYVR